MFPTLFIALISGVLFFEHWTGISLHFLGVAPREPLGLIGILGMPLVHGDWKHLFNNSIPLLVLGWALIHFYKQVAWKVLAWAWILTGLWVWVGARGGSVHIGASGLVYALASFIFFSGMLRRNKRLIALSLLVVVEYGGMVWGVFPIEPGISWEGHLFGAIAGVVLAFNYKKYGPQREVHLYEREDYNEADDEVPWDDWKLPQDRQPQPEDPNQRRVVVRYIYRRRSPRTRPMPPQPPGQQLPPAGPPPQDGEESKE